MLKGSDVYHRDAERDHAIALAELYEAHFERVWRWLHGLGVREADLEDAAQEVFVVVHRRYGDFDRRSEVTTWLYGIAFRVAAAFRRRAHVRRESVTDDMEAFTREATPSSHDLAAERQAGEIARRILDGLDDDKRAVFVLYELEEHTLKEIAAMLEISTPTVKRYWAIAKAWLFNELKREHA
jgi:RNA polymerase sigma-70 factor (ECF subfamily)